MARAGDRARRGSGRTAGGPRAPGADGAAGVVWRAGPAGWDNPPSPATYRPPAIPALDDVLLLGRLPAPLAGLREALVQRGLRLHSPRAGTSLDQALADHRPVAAVVSPPRGGPGLPTELARLRASAPGVRLIGVGPREPESVQQALRAGAADYVFDDAPLDELLEALARCAPTAADRAGGSDASPILGASAATTALREDVRKIASSRATTILIQGESGTGKDLLARAIHAASPRAPHPFVAINCSAIPDTLLEAEFFGHEPGAYTDARSRRTGLIEQAHRGTVFLDEIAELSTALQAKLLRFLEDRRLRRLGSGQDIPIDVRVIAATNVDLAEAVRLGRFRRDLYYRLLVVPLHVPPLRTRPEDVLPLARHFLARDCATHGKQFADFDAAAIERLLTHGWPGNIRELKNAIERVVLLEEGPLVTAPMLRLEAHEGERPALDAGRGTGPPSAGAPAGGRRASAGAAPAGDDLNMDHVELRALVAALERAGGNQTEAARLLGVSRDTVRYRMDKFGVKVEAQISVGQASGA